MRAVTVFVDNTVYICVVFPEKGMMKVAWLLVAVMPFVISDQDIEERFILRPVITVGPVCSLLNFN